MSGEQLLNQAKKRSQRWLEDGGWIVTDQQEVPSEVAWMLAAVDEQQRGLDVMQLLASRDVVIIQCAITVNVEHLKVINASPTHDLKTFIWDMRMRLLEYGVDFNNLTEDFTDAVLLNVTIAYDGMTKDTFMQRVALVRRSLLLYTWGILRFVEEHGGTLIETPQNAPVLGT